MLTRGKKLGDNKREDPEEIKEDEFINEDNIKRK